MSHFTAVFLLLPLLCRFEHFSEDAKRFYLTEKREREKREEKNKRKVIISSGIKVSNKDT